MTIKKGAFKWWTDLHTNADTRPPVLDIKMILVTIIHNVLRDGVMELKTEPEHRLLMKLLPVSAVLSMPTVAANSGL